MKIECVVCSYCRLENIIHCGKYVYRCAALFAVIFPVFICRGIGRYEFPATITRPHFFTLFTNAIKPFIAVHLPFGNIASTAFADFIIFFESVIYGLFEFQFYKVRLEHSKRCGILLSGILFQFYKVRLEPYH